MKQYYSFSLLLRGPTRGRPAPRCLASPAKLVTLPQRMMLPTSRYSSVNPASLSLSYLLLNCCLVGCLKLWYFQYTHYNKSFRYRQYLCPYWRFFLIYYALSGRARSGNIFFKTHLIYQMYFQVLEGTWGGSLQILLKTGKECAFSPIGVPLSYLVVSC